MRGNKLQNLDIDPADLCVPIYLDEQRVFDLLAIVDNGLSKVSTINTSTSDKDTNDSKKNVTLSLSNPFSLIGIGASFTGESNKGKEINNQNSSSTEKIHTPTSLFSKLRHILKDKGYVSIIKTQSDIRNLKCGEFVEFRSNDLKNNPLIDYFIRIRELIKLSSTFIGEPNQNIVQDNQTQSTVSNNEILRIIDEVLNDLMKSNTTEIIGKVSDDHDVNVDLSCKSDCFINNDKDILTNGEFCILGKVTNVLIGKRYKIDLLQKTSFRSLDENVIEKITDAFNNTQVKDINIPKVSTKIEAPAIQILPIAIFI